MALRRRKKPGTAQDLDALLLALTGSADAPQQAPTGKSKKRKKSKGSTALQAASPKVKALERSARKPATGGRATRTARRALQVSELTAQPASGKKERQKITPSKQKLKSSARRPAARDVMGEEEDDGNEGDDSGDDDDDCDQEDGAQAVAVARKGKSVTGAQKHVNGAPSPSSDDTGGEDFILVMKRMTLERKKQRERDARKIDAFFLARMKKSEQEAEQKILAIGAEASEATRLYRSKEITGIQKKKNAETKVIKDLTVNARHSIFRLRDLLHIHRRPQCELTQCSFPSFLSMMTQTSRCNIDTETDSFVDRPHDR